MNFAGHLDVHAQKHVRHLCRTANVVEEAHVRHGHKRPLLAQLAPGTVKRFREQPLLLFREDIIHGSIIPRHEVIDDRL